MTHDEGTLVADAALDATAHIGEHYPDDELVACVILVVLSDAQGELHTHTHTQSP